MGQKLFGENEVGDFYSLAQRREKLQQAGFQINSFSCEEPDLGIFEMSFGTPNENERSVGGFVRLAAFITANSRTILFSAIDKVQKKYGPQSIGYCDTDSIYIELSRDQILNFLIEENAMKNEDGLLHGDILGKWKVEKFIDEGIFLGPKQYALKYVDSEKLCARFLESSEQHRLFRDITEDC